MCPCTAAGERIPWTAVERQLHHDLVGMFMKKFMPTTQKFCSQHEEVATEYFKEVRGCSNLCIMSS